jgi:hypothetical protein
MVAPGTFVIHDSVRPPLDSGDYTVTLQQTLNPTNSTITPQLDPQSWAFRVVGPRFTLPPDQILSQFPPPNSSGAFGDRLAQIVLRRRTLPYERRTVTTDNVATTPPWLALVVLAPGEGQLVSNQPIDTTGLLDPTDSDASVRDVLRVSATIVNAVFPTLTDLPWLTHVREVDVSDTELALGSDGWMSVVVANRLAVPGPPAAAGGPATAVQYGAFLISLEGHAGDLPQTEQAATSFSILRVYDDETIALGVKNALAAQSLPLGTLPAIGGGVASASAEPARAQFGATSAAVTGRSVAATQPAHLADAWSESGTAIRAAGASAGGAARMVSTGRSALTGFGLSPEFLEPQAKILEFTVLAHWTFTSQPEGDFRYLMQHLDVGMIGTAPAQPQAAAPGAAPAPPATSPPMTVLDTGHLSVTGTDRGGNPTTTWYRGPFTAREIQRPSSSDPDGALAHAADQLRRVGPDGREDVTLAVAFELGRILAASNPGVIAALVGWRKTNYDAARLLALLSLGGSGIHQQLANVLAGRPPVFSAAVSAEVLAGLGANSAQSLGPTRPLFAGPSVAPGAPLTDTLSKGFGVDSAVVSGILGSQTSPPTSGLPSSATEPVAPQSLSAMTAATFAATNNAVVDQATLLVKASGAGQIQFTPPVLSGLRPVQQVVATAEEAPVEEETPGTGSEEQP